MTTNVRDFGAKGDGNDATDAFLKAAAAVPQQGGVLYIPAGMYALTRSITVRDRPVCVHGDGIGISKLMWGSGAASAGLAIVQSRTQQINTDFTRVTGLSLYTHQANVGTALTIDMTGQVHPQAKVIMNRTNPRISIEQVEIRGEDPDSQGWSRAIHLDHGHHATINQVHITGLTRGGAELGIHLDGTGSPTEIQILQCWAFHVGKAVYITGNVEGVKLSQCDFVAVAYGVFAEQCLQMNVVNSHINASHAGIVGRNVNQSSFSNLLLYKNSDACTGIGIQLEAGSACNIITSNVFVNTAPKAGMLAVVLEANANHCIVAHNVFYNRGDGILCQPGATCCQAAGNSFVSPGLRTKWQQGHHSNRSSDVL